MKISDIDANNLDRLYNICQTILAKMGFHDDVGPVINKTMAKLIDDVGSVECYRQKLITRQELINLWLAHLQSNSHSWDIDLNFDQADIDELYQALIGLES